jgi:probable F420-dependent oxidoreductase
MTTPHMTTPHKTTPHKTTMQVGVVVQPRCADYGQIRDAWVTAEGLGADSIFVWDHFLPPFDDPAAGVPNFECWALLAAMAEVTSQVRIGPLVTCVPFRNANLVADLARTVDHISRGRLVLGVGPGWFEHEFAEYGYEFKGPRERLADFETALGVISARLRRLSPPPLQRRMPLMIGSKGERVGLRLVAQHADIWHAPVELARLEPLSRVLDEWCQKQGRDPAAIQRWTSLPTESVGKADDYRALGFTQLILDITGPHYEFGPLIELLAWRDSL